MSEIPYCDICEKELSSMRVLKMHQNSKKHIENAERGKKLSDYVCQWCNASFSFQSSLSKHKHICKKKPAKLSYEDLERIIKKQTNDLISLKKEITLLKERTPPHERKSGVLYFEDFANANKPKRSRKKYTLSKKTFPTKKNTTPKRKIPKNKEKEYKNPNNEDVYEGIGPNSLGVKEEESSEYEYDEFVESDENESDEKEVIRSEDADWLNYVNEDEKLTEGDFEQDMLPIMEKFYRAHLSGRFVINGERYYVKMNASGTQTVMLSPKSLARKIYDVYKNKILDVRRNATNKRKIAKFDLYYNIESPSDEKLRDIIRNNIHHNIALIHHCSGKE